MLADSLLLTTFWAEAVSTACYIFNRGRKGQDDPLDSSVQGLVTPPTTKVNASGEEQVEGDTREEKRLRERSIKLSTVSAKKSTSSHDKGQREWKAPMLSEETPKKSKEQILQEEASLVKAIRLDSLQKEEEAKQIHLDLLLAQRIAEEEELNEQQKKRKAQVQFE
ncbi:hypothetical protein Tco_0125405, partial [Tanacetum coccineum]